MLEAVCKLEEKCSCKLLYFVLEFLEINILPKLLLMAVVV